MAKILVNKNGQVLMSADGKVYKGAVEQVIPEGYIKPTGKIEITTTDEIDVSQYAKAQVVDSNLEPQNIAKDVTILGVTGTFEGGGGSGNTSQEDGLIDGSITSYSNSKVAKLRQYAFYKMAITNIDLPNVTSIGDYAFYGCRELNEINIPLVTNIGSGAFTGCKLESIDLPNVNYVGSNAFDNSAYSGGYLKSISLPLLTNTGSYVFASCFVLESIDLPLLIKLTSGFFSKCNLLKTVNIPSVTSIDSYAFRNCIALTDIYLGYNGLVSLLHTDAFTGVTAGLKIHVRSEYANQYADATNWSSLIADGKIVIVGDYSD